MTLKIAYIFESSHIKHINGSIIRASDNLTLWQFEGDIDSTCVVLYAKIYLTEEKEADLAIFLTPVMGILAKLSIIALVLVSFMGLIELLPL